MLARDVDGAVSAGQRALDLAPPDAAATRGLALNAIGSALWFVTPDEAEAALVNGLELARRAGDEQLVASVLVNLGSGAGEIRRYDVAARWLDEAMAWCAAHDLDGRGDYATAWRARVALEQGDWATAARLAGRVTNRPGALTISRIVALTVIGTLRARRGDPEAESALDEAWDLAGRTGDLQRLWPAASARAELSWWRDGSVPDTPQLEQLLATAIESGHAWAIGDLAGWLQRAGQPHPATAAAPYASRLAGNIAHARQQWLDLGCPFEAAWAAMDEGSEASLLLALGEFEALGAATPARRCRETLRRLGTAHVPRGARPATAAHPHGLTTREDEVLALCAKVSATATSPPG